MSKDGKVRVTHSQNSKRKLSPPLVLEPLGAPSYYEKRPVWSLDILFKNKMLVMLAVMMGGTLLLSKMMANMDPEEMKKMQQVRALCSRSGQLCFTQRDLVGSLPCPPGFVRSHDFYPLYTI